MPDHDVSAFSVTQEAETYANYLLCLSLDIGEELLKSGAEVHRVEDTIERICRAYGAVHIEVFAINSLIMASVRLPDKSYSSQIRRVYSSSIRLSRMERMNALSRSICRDCPPLEEADRMIRETRAQRDCPFGRFLLGSAFTAAAFTVFFGGNLRDALIAALLGIFTAGVEKIHSSYINQMAKLLIVSFMVGGLANLGVFIGVGVHVDAIIIGTIMLLIPGLAFGNAIRDLLCGDILAGILKTVQSCLSAILIAFGFMLATMLMKLCGIMPQTASTEPALPILLLTALLGTAAFALFFHSRLRYLPIVGICGFFTCLIFELAIRSGMMAFFAAFFASLFNGFYATVSARIFRAPALIFSSLGAIPIVPGSALYYTMVALLSNEQATVESMFGKTLLISAGLALGTITVSLIATVIIRLLSRRHDARSNRPES